MVFFVDYIFESYLKRIISVSQYNLQASAEGEKNYDHKRVI